MKKTLLLAMVAVLLVPFTAFAQEEPQTVTIRELNAYENLTEYDEDLIEAHPLAGETVRYTAVIVSYPKSSGLATPVTDGEGNVTSIGRIHVFVTDTSAVNQGREGMSIQVVESDYQLLEGFTRGDVVTFVGRLTFFGGTSQMTVDQEPQLLGNVNDGFPEYADLLNPWEISASDLNIANDNGTFQINIENYSKYNGAYVKINNGTVSNVSLGDRPNWRVNEGGSSVYVYDTSLRYRNDRVSGYLPSYNFRRLDGADGAFEPPAPGSIVNISGFITMNGDDPDGTVVDGSNIFSINPFEDGVVWLNGQRFVDGQDVGGTTFEWPNDFEVIGSPPNFANEQLSVERPTSSDEVTVTVDIAGVDGATVTDASITYSVGDTETTTNLTNTSGNTYSFTFPAFENFDAVSYYFNATDSEGLTGRYPVAGAFNFLVQDEALTSIEQLQRTSNSGAGASPLTGVGIVELNITGTIVADNNDGVIIVHDNAGAWGGIFLEKTAETIELQRGDEITITAGAVNEASVASNPSITLTQLVDVEFTVNSSGNDMDAVIPVITTDDVQRLQQDDELEPYEGMVVKFEQVQAIDRGRFGEYTLQSVNADSAGGAIFNEDIRSDDQVGSVGIPGDINQYIRFDVTMDVYAVVAASFGAPKFHPRSLEDFVADNWSKPVLEFGLQAPADGAEVVVEGDVVVNWQSTTDYDGDAVTYQWVLYNIDQTEEIVSFASEDEGQTNSLNLAFAQVDELLESLGLAVGESVETTWNVRVSDGSDTLNVASDYSDRTDEFTNEYYALTLVRGTATSNEDELGIPATYALDQNYPNPFNPVTQISFDLPQASEVTLRVYDMLGRQVATIVNERMTAGTHIVPFNANQLASGMYIYRIDAGTFTQTRKMMLIK